MVTPRPEQTQAIRMSWHVVIDLSHPNAVQDVEALAHLDHGRRVTVNVGQTSPWDVDIDSRIAQLLVERARDGGLHLELQGSIGAIAEWWKALRYAEDPIRASRHLRVVKAPSTRPVGARR